MKGAREDPDNWWWCIVEIPGEDTHVYELGYATIMDTGEGEKVSIAMTDERQREIIAERGNPAAWAMHLCCGRPGGPKGERYLKPKAYDEQGELLPIEPHDGVILHPKGA